MTADGSERVDYDEINSAFRGAEIERDGIIAEVEAVKTASDDSRDEHARYTLDVRARSLSTGSEHSERTDA